MTHPIPLGSEVVDKISGFRGRATACVYYLTGCTQICVAPPVDEKGNLRDSMYFDYQRLEVVDFERPDTGKSDTGGPQREVPSH